MLVEGSLSDKRKNRLIPSEPKSGTVGGVGFVPEQGARGCPGMRQTTQAEFPIGSPAKAQTAICGLDEIRVLGLRIELYLAIRLAPLTGDAR
jgi:hypothetical protein